MSDNQVPVVFLRLVEAQAIVSFLEKTKIREVTEIDGLINYIAKAPRAGLSTAEKDPETSKQQDETPKQG